MKTTLMITAFMIALAVVNTCKGEGKTTHIVLIEHGYVTVCKSDGQPLWNIKIADMAAADQRPMPKTRDDRRHFALNAVAAAVAGGGNRDNRVVDPAIRVTTIDESKTNNSDPSSVTLERGIGFAIIRDTDSKSGYRAEIISWKAE